MVECGCCGGVWWSVVGVVGCSGMWFSMVGMV